jgi:hypothetical protein
MNEHLRDRILRRLDTLSDERGYQVLDYVEFLESKFAERQSPGDGMFVRLTDSVEDTLRAGRVSATVIAETIAFLNRASGVLNVAMAAGRSVAEDVMKAGKEAKAIASPTRPAPTPALGAGEGVTRERAANGVGKAVP